MSSVSPLLLATTLLFMGGSMCAHAEDPESLTEGITYTDGIFFPTHTISGMTYNPETKNYEVTPSTETSPPSGNTSQSLPDATPLLEAYNASSDKTQYVKGLTSPEQASLFLGLSPEQKSAYISHIHPPNTSDSALLKNDRLLISNFLAQIPDSNLIDTLNLFGDYSSPIFPGAPLSWGSIPTGAYSQIDLSGRNLSGWDVTGKNLTGANLANTQISAAQLNSTAGGGARGPLSDGTVLSGLDLTGLDMTKSYYIGTNFAGSNITAAQINAIVPHAYYPWRVNLSGRDLTGVDMSNRILEDSNFSNATGLTATQLAKAKSLTGSSGTYYLNLVGTGITQADLQAALDAEGKTANMANIIFGP